MKRINLTFSDNQFKQVAKNARAADVRPGTWCKIAAMQAAGIQLVSDFVMPKKIKQLDLFNHGEKKYYA